MYSALLSAHDNAKCHSKAVYSSHQHACMYQALKPVPYYTGSRRML
jgi:hypothetical protein